MAAEVMALEYFFVPESLSLSLYLDEAVVLPPFRHNPIHDMESVWWCQIWIFFFNYCRQKYEETKQQHYARQSATDRIFPGYVDAQSAGNRLSYLLAPVRLSDGIKLTSWSTEGNITRDAYASKPYPDPKRFTAMHLLKEAGLNPMFYSDYNMYGQHSLCLH